MEQQSSFIFSIVKRNTHWDKRVQMTVSASSRRSHSSTSRNDVISKFAVKRLAIVIQNTTKQTNHPLLVKRVYRLQTQPCHPPYFLHQTIDQMSWNFK